MYVCVSGLSEIQVQLGKLYWVWQSEWEGRAIPAFTSGVLGSALLPSVVIQAALSSPKFPKYPETQPAFSSPFTDANSQSQRKDTSCLHSTHLPFAGLQNKHACSLTSF